MADIDADVTRLWCLRHGESMDNVAGVLSAAVPGSDLTDRGRGQASVVAESLATEPVVAVYASPALRAQATAAPIARRFGLPVRTRPDLIEWQLGEYEGRSDPEARQMCTTVAQAWYVDGDLDVGLPGGDSGRELVRRCIGALTGIAADHPGQTVAVVSHGAALSMSVLELFPQFTGTVWGRPIAHAKPFLLTYRSRSWECDAWPGDPVTGGLFYAGPDGAPLDDQADQAG